MQRNLLLINFAILSANIRGFQFLRTKPAIVIGATMILSSFFLNIPALLIFLKTKNSVVTIKPATSLQTKGVYSVSRNPMYVSLFLLYVGFSLIIGNWWNFILFPLLFLIVKEYVVKREEKYLERRFGQHYKEYKKKTRRWL